MQKTIQTLSTEVINQIAAGEVVERPANMVKELIENSLDAGANHIELLFSEGGRFVQIKDDGCGIRDSELNLALSPHSTSKIANLKDIWAIKSYGFRGEALASIAEVSDLTLISRPPTQEQSARLSSAFGKKTAVQRAGSEKGTTVIVQNLFQNTPARLKFLKSDSSETTAIKNTIKAMALSHPAVSFRIRHKNQLLFYWPGTKNLQMRAQQILKIKNSFYTKTQYRDIHVEACLSAPNETTSNRRQMWFFVEGRWVEDSALHSAVMTAYRGLLMHGEYPILVLNLTCRKEDLDVNVHPAKSRVRFKNPSTVFKAVQTSLRAVLEKGPWLDKSSSSLRDKQESQELGFKAQEFQQTHFQTKDFTGKESEPKSAGKGKAFQNNRSGAYSADFPRRAFSPVGQGNMEKGQISRTLQEMNMPALDKSSKELALSGAPSLPEDSGLSPGGLSLPPEDPGLSPGGPSPSLEGPSLEGEHSTTQEGEKAYWSSLAVLAQAHLTYIVAQNRRALVFIDQHAAHERVLYERLMLSYNKGGEAVQNRLVPLALDMEESLVQALFSAKTDLSKIGIKMELSGPEGILVHSAPAILKDVALQKSLWQLGEEIRNMGGSFAMEKHISSICATMACHSAVRAGQALSPHEMKELLVQMDEFPLSSFCPHGRPVFVDYSLSRLEKDFGRKP